MKQNLAQYLREFGDKTFREVPFSEVDALLLAQFSYLKMEGIVPGFGKAPGMTWAQMREHEDFEKLFTDPLYGKVHRKMFELVAKSRRYRQVKINYFTEWFDEEQEVQFAAVTFVLGATSFFISYRGTDETIVGWKEDFNMGFMESVPAQRRALAYLKGVARYTESGRLILGGHSKGGNLAIFAAARAPQQIQRRIRRVYSFDGPGFHRGFYERDGFLRIEPKYCKIVPEQSLVGFLMTNYRRYRVVESYKRGFGQHDLMQWKIQKGKFIYRRDVYRRSSRKTGMINAWIDSLNAEQISLFVETVYELLVTASVKSVVDLFKAPFRLVRRIMQNFRNMDRERKKSFWKIIRKWFAAVFGFSTGQKKSGS